MNQIFIIPLYILLLLDSIESYEFGKNRKDQLNDNRDCPKDKIPVLSNDGSHFDCVECTGSRKQKSYLCLKNNIKDTSIECSNFIEFPQCPPYSYCNKETFKCEKLSESDEYVSAQYFGQKIVDSNSPLYDHDYYGHYHKQMTSKMNNKCPDGLIWSNQYMKCVQCLHKNINLPGINSNEVLNRYSFVQNYECHNGYKVHKLPSKELISSSPYSLFSLFILCILIYTLIIKIVFELKYYIGGYDDKKMYIKDK